MTISPHAPKWEKRRSLVFATCAYCAVLIAYLALYGADTFLSRALAEGAYMLAGAVIGSYVFGATWDDKNAMQHLEKLGDKEGKP